MGNTVSIILGILALSVIIIPDLYNTGRNIFMSAKKRAEEDAEINWRPNEK